MFMVFEEVASLTESFDELRRAANSLAPQHCAACGLPGFDVTMANESAAGRKVFMCPEGHVWTYDARPKRSRIVLLLEVDAWGFEGRISSVDFQDQALLVPAPGRP